MIRRFGAFDDSMISAEIIGDRSMRRAASAALGVESASWSRDGMEHTAYRQTWEGVQLREGYLYVRNRAVSSRFNLNGDGFPSTELATEAPGFGYQTFVGKPVFVNHHNDNVKRARGVNIASALHEDVNPDGSPDTWVELLKEVDARKFPKLAQALLKGRINRTSMGVDCLASRCHNHCDNWATSPADFCNAIPAMKCVTIEQRGADGSSRMAKVGEILVGLAFFEDSLLVEPPADSTAAILGIQDHSGMMA